MYGIFVNSDGCVPYADAIVDGYKTIETRTRNMLWHLDGKRVAIVKTRRGKNPTIVGYVTVSGWELCRLKPHGMCNGNCPYRDKTLIPEGSKYDCHGKGKWFYHLENPQRCEPYPLSKDAVRHGRSWCEFNI